MFENIRRLRLEHHLTQKQLADIVGITQQCINNYENRSTYPSYDVLMRMSDFFQVSMDYLCLGEQAAQRSCLDAWMKSYTEEDQLLHEKLFAELPINQKRTIDTLIVFLSHSNKRFSHSPPGDTE